MTEQQKIQFTKENKAYFESMIGTAYPEYVRELLKMLNPYMLAYQEKNNRWWLAKDERAVYYQLFVKYSVINYSEFTNKLKKIVGNELDMSKLSDKIYLNNIADIVKEYYEKKYNRKLAPPITVKELSGKEKENMDKLVDGLSR